MRSESEKLKSLAMHCMISLSFISLTLLKRTAGHGHPRSVSSNPRRRALRALPGAGDGTIRPVYWRGAGARGPPMCG